jgi:hypothetical protein
MDQCTGQTRRRKAAQKFAAWLAAGTITVGLGAAMASGTAVAYADTGSPGTGAHSTSDSSNSTATKHDSASSPRRAVGKATSRPTAAGLATAPNSRPSLTLVPDTSTAAKTKASATPQVPTPKSVLSDISRQINYIFFNKAPTADPSQDGQAGPKKQITGAVNGVSHNGFDATYTVTEQPKYGKVTLDPKTGEFAYVARDELVTPGITDQFTVRVSNGAAAKLPGLLGQLQFALHSIAVALGVAKPDTIEKDIVVKVTGTGIYGTQAAQKGFWLEQTIDNDCVLIADAAIIAQLGGPKLTEAEIVAVGKTTTSTVDPTKPMYVGTKADTGFLGLYNADDVALLKNYGINATYKSYVDDPEPGEAPNKATQVDGQRALSDVEAALAAGKAVAVVVDAGLIVNASGADVPTPDPEANHWVVVTGVDIANGKVYLNDGNLPAGSTPVSMAGFMWSWQSSDFGVIVAENAAIAA